MTKIAYTGTSDFQEFSKADFTKAGVEDGKALRFAQGEPTDVPDELAEVLLSDEGLFGGHMFYDLSDVEEGKNEAETEANLREAGQKAIGKVSRRAASESDDDTGTPAKSGKKAKAEGAGDDAGGTSTRSTGRGSSTGGASSTS